MARMKKRFDWFETEVFTEQAFLDGVREGLQVVLNMRNQRKNVDSESLFAAIEKTIENFDKRSREDYVIELFKGR